MVTYVSNYGEVASSNTPHFNLIDNYIYLYHTDTLIILPTFPDSINDQSSASFSNTPILGRSAPIYAFSSAGPRSIDVRLQLHRDMMNEINVNSNAINYGLNIFEDTDDDSYLKKLRRKDYIDLMINELQSIALPNYIHGQKMVDPPLVAVRFGDQVFCKGIVDGGVSTQYQGPILANPLTDANGDYVYDTNGKKVIGKGKYALVDISFKVTEVDPYDANTIAQIGSFRGLNRSLEKNLYKVST